MSFDTNAINPDRIYSLGDLERTLGLQRWDVSRLLQKGVLDSLGTGVYVHRDFVPGLQDDLAIIALRCPEAVFNLYTSADLHEMNNRTLQGVYVGIPASQRAPTVGGNFVTKILATRWSREIDMTVGVEERIVRAVPIRLTDPERTVCDMWRYSMQNPGLRGNPKRIGDEELSYALRKYLDVNDGATSALAEMMYRLDAPRSTQDAFVQYLRAFTSGYEHNRVF
ncbi:hypothetical protein G6L37_05005 [Agrobacterium rubi]|nr:hypothetical protein [Agrobacterium rubi]NTF24714.1 hypothetical protein [Agrobacterium rubi]